MPELPDQEKSKSISTGKSLSFTIGHYLPVVHSLHTNILIQNGWVRVGNEYHKDNFILKYDGVKWRIGTIIFQFIEQVNEYLTTGKLPEQ